MVWSEPCYLLPFQIVIFAAFLSPLLWIPYTDLSQNWKELKYSSFCSALMFKYIFSVAKLPSVMCDKVFLFPHWQNDEMEEIDQI